tara:strand:- start:62433 stop:62948 length:516 start_codon:yes stop_codon:yes gene_type:complete
MYKLYLVVLLILMNGCLSDCPAPELLEIGDPYFELECTWVDPWPPPPGREAVWRCGGDVETDTLSGLVFLELEHADSLYFCGRDLTLNSGLEIYDNLVSLLTTDSYNCLHITEDKEKENQFDWNWDEEKGWLQMIWRPEDASHKMITLIVENAEYGTLVKSTVYYKILSSD